MYPGIMRKYQLSFVVVALLAAIGRAGAVGEWSAADYWTRANDFDATRAAPLTMTRDELVKSLENPEVIFTDGGDIYMRAPDSFWSAIAGPIVLHNGKVVGVAFERILRQESGAPTGNTTNDLILCDEDEPYFSANLWMKLAKAVGVPLEIRYDSGYKTSMITVGQAKPLIFRSQWNVTSIAERCFQDHQERLTYGPPRGQWNQAKALIGYDSSSDEDENGIRGSEEAIMSSILVDGQWYAPVNLSDEDSDYECPRRKGDDACLKLDQPPFKVAVFNGKSIAKFIQIGETIYVHENFWDDYLGYDPNIAHYSISDQSYVYIYNGEFDARYFRRAFPLPKQMRTYRFAQLQADWAAIAMKPSIETWTDINRKSILVDGSVAISVKALEDDKFTERDQKLYYDGAFIVKYYDGKTTLNYYKIGDDIYVPVSVLKAAKLVGANSTKDMLVLLGEDGATGNYQLRTSGLKSYRSADLVAQHQAALAKQQRDAQVQQQQQAAQAQRDAALRAAINKQRDAVMKKVPDMNVVYLGENEFGAFKVSNHKLFIKMFTVNSSGIITSSCYQQSTDQAIVLSAQPVGSAPGFFRLLVSSASGPVYVLYTHRNNAAVCTLSIP